MNFAYRPFKWSNSAANDAGVWCTIIGLETQEKSIKHLFLNDQVKRCDNIAPYLIPGPNIICKPRRTPISELSHMKMGSNPVDGRRLILSSDEANNILKQYQDASKFIHKYGGTDELVSGKLRYCLWINDNQTEEAKNIQPLKDIIRNCKIYREGAGRDARKAAKRPHAFCYSTFENKDFIQIGNTIGNAFSYVPADLKKAGFVSNHASFTIYGVNLKDFSIIISSCTGYGQKQLQED